MRADRRAIGLIGASSAGLAAALAGPTVAGVALVAVGLWIVRSDVSHYIVPDEAVAALAAIGATLRLSSDGVLGEPIVPVAQLAFDAALSGGMLWAVREVGYRRRGYDVLGFGDVKLGAAAGLLVGAMGFTWALLVASVAGLLAAAVRAAFMRELPSASMRLPFAAFLAPASVAVWALGVLRPAAV